MKRKLLILIFLLASCFGFSQSELYVLHSSTEEYSDSYRDSWYVLSHYKGAHEVLSGIVKIKLNYFDFFNDDPSNDCGGPCGQYADQCKGAEFSEEKIIFDKIEIESNSIDCLPISYHAVLLPKIIVPSDRRCERDPLFDQYSDGQDHNVTGLVWEYVDKNGDWKELPNYKSRYPLNVSLLDVFGANWREKIGANLNLRFMFTAPFTTDTVASIQNYTITLTECSPELTINPPVTQKTTCSYGNDGRFTLTVDRDLTIDEKLIVSLYQKDASHPDGFSFLTQEDTKALQNNNNSTYSYIWKGDLAPQEYRIKFQTLIGDGDIPGTDLSWAKLNESKSFTILTATNLQFDAKKLNDENCFKVGDGKIQLEVTSGETGRSYLYIVYKVEETTETLERDWTSFSGTSTVISGLTKGKYKIKVKDSKDCLAKE